jgi:solute carrier family 10 (sodium/bile acid cotransporter), member 7
MTRNAGGNVESATAEVVVGNVIGVFITPSLLSAYLKPLRDQGFTQPDASGSGGLVGIYTLMIKQLSACLFAPLVSMFRLDVGIGLNLCRSWDRLFRT